MPSFEYLAADSNGNTVQSIVFGRTMDEASEALRQQGLRVIQIKDAYGAHDPLRQPEGILQPAMATAGPGSNPSWRSIRDSPWDGWGWN